MTIKTYEATLVLNQLNGSTKRVVRVISGTEFGALDKLKHHMGNASGYVEKLVEIGEYQFDEYFV